MIFKLITYYLFITLLCYTIAKIKFIINKPNCTWKHYIEDEDFFGVAFSVLKLLGIITGSLILLVLLTKWYFEL